VSFDGLSDMVEVWRVGRGRRAGVVWLLPDNTWLRWRRCRTAVDLPAVPMRCRTAG
jgi:hypothetical protein